MKENLSRASIEPLLAYFDNILPLNSEEKQPGTSKFHPRLFRKWQYVLQELNLITTSKENPDPKDGVQHHPISGIREHDLQ